MKIITKYFIVIAFVMSIATPAFALKIDAAQIASKISDFTTKITDTTTKITDGISKAKEIATKGFSKEALLGALPINDIMAKLSPEALLEEVSRQGQQAVANTLAKEQRALQAELDFHTQSATAYYNAQVKILEDSLNEVKVEQETVKRDLIEKRRRAEATGKSCEEARKRGDDNTAKICDEYENLAIDVTNLEMSESELKLAEDDMKKNIEVLNDEASKVGTEHDGTYMQQKAKMDAIANSKSDDIVIAADVSGEDEWDTNNVTNKLSVSDKVYQDFIRKYFYDSSSVTENEEGGTNLMEDQVEIERVMRYRRQLILSTATHLLQVSASARRDLPNRMKASEEMYEGVVSSDSELEAIGFYSGTRMENMRTLLLYAKMQAAKLQYMAAKDLLITYPQRRGSVEDASMSNFDLSRYKLTQEYVDLIEKESNEVRDLHKGVEE